MCRVRLFQMRGHILRSILHAAKYPKKKIHCYLSEVCSGFTVDRSMVSRCASRFRVGCVSIDNDPRTGRPRTSADERSVKLVADALEVDRRAICEELSRDTGAKTYAENGTRTDLSWSSQ